VPHGAIAKRGVSHYHLGTMADSVGTESAAADSPGIALRALSWLGIEDPDRSLLSRLERYAEWLIEEAVPAGGLGPRESPRIWGRHVADSLVFATAWRDGAPRELLDVGSGVGLPGIPLALLWPETHVTLLDRGGRRTRLLNRAKRLLDLDNVVVAQGDAFDVADEWAGITFRGSVRAPEAVGLAARMLDVPGRAVLGLSRKAEPPGRTRDLVGVASAMGLEAEVVGVPAEVLDGPAWMLIMRIE
jgi:16S rRNA (guanine527-N7)-methyltransferase